jgi:hypothetical protein
MAKDPDQLHALLDEFSPVGMASAPAGGGETVGVEARGAA